MKVTERAKQGIKIELDRFEAVMLYSILNYCEPYYMEELAKSKKKGVHIVSEDAFERLYKELKKDIIETL